MKASEAARATAEWFTDNQWLQGHNLDPVTGARCINGALCLVAPALSAEWDNVVNGFVSRTGSTVTRYNDTPGRTVDEVIHTLKLVAEDLEMEGL